MVKAEKGQTLHGFLQVDGDKSLTVRAILLGAIASGKTIINGALVCNDTLATISCARKLGAKIYRRGNKISITGTKKIANNAIFDCKNSATLARLLIGILSGAGAYATVKGDKSLSSRPMARVCDPLILRGAKITTTNGKLPIKIYPATLQEYSYFMQVDSAQVKSALLLSGLISKKTTVVTERNKTRDHTEKMIEYLGGNISVNNKQISLCESSLIGNKISILKDPSSASFYLSMGLVLGEVTVEKVLLTDSRAGFYNKLKSVNAHINYSNVNNSPFGKSADITAKKSEIYYFEITSEEIPSLIDELPIICAVACLNKGCKIFGASELRVKESDRLNGICELLSKAGARCEVFEDDLVVYPIEKGKYFEYESTDHRLLMTAFVLGVCLNGCLINNEKWVDVSFPNFFKNFYLNRLGLVGVDLSKSQSGVMHKFILGKLRLSNFTFEQRSLNENAFDDFMQKCPYKAFNATIPYKERLFLDSSEKSEKAVMSKSANYYFNGVTYTTDGDGLYYALKQKGVEVNNKNILVYGVGGAGRSIALSLLRKGGRVFVANRTFERAQNFSSYTNGKVQVYNGERCDILINATAVSNSDIFCEEQIKNAFYVVDINYGKPSALLLKAKELNVACEDGFAMLFMQAYLSDCILLNKKPQLKMACALYKKFIGEKYENRSD